MRRKKTETDTKMVLMAKNMLATGFCISTAVVVFNPLDCLRIRWQVDRNTSTMTRFAKDIMKRQGLIRGLWAPGLGSNAVGAAMARGYVVGLLFTHVQHNTHTHHLNDTQHWYGMLSDRSRVRGGKARGE